MYVCSSSTETLHSLNFVENGNCEERYKIGTNTEPDFAPGPLQMEQGATLQVGSPTALRCFPNFPNFIV